MSVFAAQIVAAISIASEQPGDGGMINWLFAFVEHQILLADIGDIAAFHILGEQVVKGLVLGRPDVERDSVVPFIAIGKDRIDIENHAAKIEQAVPNDIANCKIRMGDRRQRDGGIGREGGDVRAVHAGNLVVVARGTSGMLVSAE